MHVDHESVTIKLSAPFENWFGKTISEIRLEAPSAGDLFKLGEPQTYISSPNGNITVIDELTVQGAYLDRCVKDIENAGAFVSALPLRDGRRIKRALLNFFRDADEATSAASSA